MAVSGRMTVVFRPEFGDRGKELLENEIKKPLSVEHGLEEDERQAEDHGVYFSGLEVASVEMEAAEAKRLNRILSDENLAYEVRPELTFHSASSIYPAQAGRMDYWSGFSDGVDAVVRRMRNTRRGSEEAWGTYNARISAADSRDSDGVSVELSSMGVRDGGPIGAGIRVGVLDSGIDFRHPEWSSRAFNWQSYLPGAIDAQDRWGHGTHCTGLIAGTVAPATTERYGVAPGVELSLCQVLDALGNGTERNILRGIQWVVRQRCRVACLALSTKVPYPPSAVETYERFASWAMANGCLLVAAAGNESDRRFGRLATVGLPAAAPSVLGVGALSQSGAIHYQSNTSGSGNGAQVDMVAPGENVFSSWSTSAIWPGNGIPYWRDTGSSMATAFAAGVAALWAEANPTLSASLLGNLVRQKCRRLGIAPQDAGSGLIQAP